MVKFAMACKESFNPHQWYCRPQDQMYGVSMRSAFGMSFWMPRSYYPHCCGGNFEAETESGGGLSHPGDGRLRYRRASGGGWGPAIVEEADRGLTARRRGRI